MIVYKKNKLLLEKTHNYCPEMEHDACGVGLIASTDGKKSKEGSRVRHRSLKSNLA